MLCVDWLLEAQLKVRTGNSSFHASISLNVTVSTSEELYWLFGPCALSGVAVSRYPVEGKGEASVCDAVPSILVKSCL